MDRSIAYVLTEWIRNYESELDAYGFPFDQGYLVRFQRMKEVYLFLRGMSDDIGEFSELKSFLGSVIGDPEIQKSVQLLQKKTADFTELRNAMRIALPDGKDGLNDDGDDGDDMETIEKASQDRGVAAEAFKLHGCTSTGCVKRRNPMGTSDLYFLVCVNKKNATEFFLFIYVEKQI